MYYVGLSSYRVFSAVIQTHSECVIDEVSPRSSQSVYRILRVVKTAIYLLVTKEGQYHTNTA